MRKKLFIVPLLTLSLAAVCGCQESTSQTATQAPKIPAVVTMDMDRLLAESEPGKKMDAHLKEVQAVLQKGYNDLEETFKDAPDPEKKRIYAEGLAKLNRQMEVERQAAIQVVHAVLVDEIEKWRASNGVSLVIPRNVVLAGNWEATDYTTPIMDAANNRTVKFADLPVVSIKPREQAEPASAPAKTAPAKAPAKDSKDSRTSAKK